jgi:addiction module HigA family antidote
MPMKNPPHPGDFIRTEIIEPAGLTVTAAAIALRVSRPTLSSLLNGKANLSGDMALRNAYAVILRYRPNPQARETNQCAAHFLPYDCALVSSG